MSRLRRRLWLGQDRGFTMVEVVVVMMVMSLVMGAVLGALNSITGNERRQQSLVHNQELVRFAMLDMARDLRSATALAALSSTSSYPYEVDAAIVNADGSTGFVRWQLSGTTLTRSVQSSLGGTTTSTKNVVTNVRNVSQNIPLLQWYDQNDALIDPATRPTGDFQQCTIRLHVTISANSDPGPLPFTEQSDIELRNRLPGGLQC